MCVCVCVCKIYIYVSCSLLPLSYFLVTTSLTRALCAVAYIAPKAAASRIVCKLRLPRHGLDKVRAQLSHSPTHTHTLSHTHTHTHTLSLSLTHSLTRSLTHHMGDSYAFIHSFPQILTLSSILLCTSSRCSLMERHPCSWHVTGFKWKL